MDEFYIKENNRWTGPFVQSEFEVKIAGMNEVVFWKPEFCPNQILHPALCSHFKTMGKRTQETQKEPENQYVPSEKEQAMGSEEIPENKITAVRETPEPTAEKNKEETVPLSVSSVQPGNNGKNTASKPEETVREKEAPAKPDEKDQTTLQEKEPELEIPPEEKIAEPEKTEEPEIASHETGSTAQQDKAGEPAKTEEQEVTSEETGSTVQPEEKAAEPKKKKAPEPAPAAEKPVKEPLAKTEPPVRAPQAPSKSFFNKENDKQDYLLKMAVIVIGFLLIILAGFYVNSRLSVVKYQDTIIRNYINEINTRTTEIYKEQQVLRKKMDSLKLLLNKEMKASKGMKPGNLPGNNP